MRYAAGESVDDERIPTAISSPWAVLYLSDGRVDAGRVVVDCEAAGAGCEVAGWVAAG